MTDSALVPVVQAEVAEVSITRAPEEQLSEAQAAAKALMSVVSKKAKPVRFNGETYLEYEDWQTVGKFYGLSARVTGSKYIEVGTAKGYEASAELVHVPTGQVVSSADAMCLNDEPNWMRKPLFQLRSMAQTRACAKAFRNAVSWVVVLAGYKPTPAEEMDGVIAEAQRQAPAPKSAAKPAAKPKEPPPEVFDAEEVVEDPEDLLNGAIPGPKRPVLPEKEIPEDAYTLCDVIDRLTKKETKRAGTYRYGIHLKGLGKWCNFFDEKLAAAAEVEIELKTPLILTVRDTQYGTDVITWVEDTRTAEDMA